MIMFGLILHCRYARLVGLLVVVVSSTQNKEKFAVSGDYDMFLKVRGGDVSSGFNDFLHNSLVAAGVRVFRGDDDLPMGEEIFGGLILAIRSSKISIPVISKDYAGSQSCLQELTGMIKCQEIGGQLIFPMFYKVSVDEVQELDGRVGEALRWLNGTVDANTTRQWENTLQSVAKIRWESHNGNANAMRQWEEGWESHKVDVNAMRQWEEAL